MSLLVVLACANGLEPLHSMGSGRPFGFGQVRVKVVRGADGTPMADLARNDGEPVEPLEAYARVFRDIMEQHFPGWEESETVHYLRRMADPAAGERNIKRLVYQRLGKGKENEFVQARKDGEWLGRYEPLKGMSGWDSLEPIYRGRRSSQRPATSGPGSSSEPQAPSLEDDPLAYVKWRWERGETDPSARLACLIDECMKARVKLRDVKDYLEDIGRDVLARWPEFPDPGGRRGRLPPILEKTIEPSSHLSGS